AARTILLADDDWKALLPEPSQTTTRELPNPLSAPAVTIRAPGNVRANMRQSQVRIMVNAWVPGADVLADLDDPIFATDPEELAWDIAALAGDILDVRSVMGRGPSFPYRDASWRGQWTEGPTLPDPDLSRGADTPLYRAWIYVVMNIVTPVPQ
ncbi:hypothetical protein, partial [Jatrophihabitans endophyticus]|uniref:hypothetical protein n=1 Tax=Jatrophihabitans endophyticus TaxID=1206085 RepID=UPI0019DE5CE6